MIDASKIEISSVDVRDEPDGSAVVSVSMSHEALVVLASIGLKTVLEEAVRHEQQQQP